jgi:diguanylate cyclase (GGDEF)-like protein/PAS domain S-box-containing protein
MQRFFAPAIALMNHLSYARKAVLLGAVSLVAVAVVTYSLYTHLAAAIEFSKRELKGLELIDPMSRAVQGMQEHRGLCMVILSGNGTFRQRREARVGEVDAALGLLAGKLSAVPVLHDGLRGIMADWEPLRQELPAQTLDDCFDAHTRLIDRMHGLKQDVADEHWLTLDPDHRAYWLIESAFRRLPAAIERLGQLRAHGVRVLGKKQISEAQKIHLSVLVAALDIALDALREDMERAARYNPEMRAALLALLDDITSTSRNVIEVTRSELLATHSAPAPGEYFMMATASIDQVYGQLRETLVPMTADLLRVRLSEAENTLRTSLGIALALFLVVGYLTAGGYLAVAGNVQSLARSARAFAGGDLRERVRLDTRDELATVGSSFNEMADGFNLLLEEQRRDAARLRELSTHLEERVAARTRDVELAARRNEVVLATTMDGFWLTNLEGVLEEANAAYASMSGYAREELVGMRISDLEAQEQPEDTQAHIEKLKTEGYDRFETLHRRKDGTVIDVEISVMLLPEFERLVVFCRDITERKRAEEEIRQLAFYDTLTNLPNRRLFMERMRAALPASARHQDHGAVLFIDMDRFKTLNDTLGHARGDMMLIEVAQRLRACVREMDTVARLGGDEFVVLIEGAGGGSLEASCGIGSVAEKIRQALAHPYLLDGHEFHSSPSIGIAIFHGHDESVDTLLRQADMAMYQAKAAGRNAVRFFDPALQLTEERGSK